MSFISALNRCRTVNAHKKAPFRGLFDCLCKGSYKTVVDSRYRPSRERWVVIILFMALTYALALETMTSVSDPRPV